MIELYKIMTGKNDTDATPNIPRGPINQTRGHLHKIFEERMRLNQRKYSFISQSQGRSQELFGCTHEISSCLYMCILMSI